MALIDTASMSLLPLNISLISETFLPEINGVANTLARLCDGLRARGHRLQLVRPRQACDQGSRAATSCCWCAAGHCPATPACNGASRACTNCSRAGSANARTCSTSPPRARSASPPCAPRGLGIPAISGFHTNFQQYTGHYGVGLLTRLMTNYLRWFHNASQLTLVPSASQSEELRRRGFERLALLARRRRPAVQPGPALRRIA